MATLYELEQEQMKLYDMLCNSINEETGEVDEVIEIALNVTKEQIEKKCKQYAIVYKQLMADAKMYKEEEDRITQKRQRIEKNALKLKERLEGALLSQNIMKIDDPKVSIAFRKSKKVVILDEGVLTKEYLTEVTTIKPNKTKISDALKLGMQVEGAELVETQNIQIN